MLSLPGGLQQLPPKTLALYDPVYFAVRYLARTKPPKPMPKHQVEILDTLVDINGQPIPGKYLFLEPRGHGKTDTIAFCYAIWRLCCDHNTRILFIGEEGEQAAKHSTRIKEELEGNNPELVRDYNIQKGHRWKNRLFYLRRDAKLKDPSVEAVGLNKAITGGRFDLIIADDMLSELNTLTPEVRKKTENWFLGTIDPILTPTGQWVVIGTHKHWDDLYSKLRKQGSGFSTIVRKAIIDEEKRQVLWPEEWSYARLMQKRQEWLDMRGPIGGLIFIREYQNEPVHLEGQEFKLDWLRYWGPDHALKPHGLPRYAGVDPAVGKSAKGSYAAIVTLEADLTNKLLYIVDFWRGHISMGQLPQIIGQLYEKWNWRAVGIESVFWQAELARAMSKYGLPVVPIDYRKRRAPSKKYDRLQELGLPFSAGTLFLPIEHPMTSIFVHHEYTPFPEGAHDDLLDALWIARAVTPRGRKRRYRWA